MHGLFRNPSSEQAKRRMSWQGPRKGLQQPITSWRTLHMQGLSPQMSQPQVKLIVPCQWDCISLCFCAN